MRLRVLLRTLSHLYVTLSVRVLSPSTPTGFTLLRPAGVPRQNHPGVHDIEFPEQGLQVQLLLDSLSIILYIVAHSSPGGDLPRLSQIRHPKELTNGFIEN